MKYSVLVAILAVGIGTGKTVSLQAQGHAAPKPQEAKADAPSAPAGEIALGTITLGTAVKADGKLLAAGTYQVRLTAQEASPAAKGQTSQLERWVEFLKGKNVEGREVATIVPKSEIAAIVKDAPPPSGGYKVELLKGNDYVRVWINRGGNYYLIHLPPA